jgi:hypothetical protein
MGCSLGSNDERYHAGWEDVMTQVFGGRTLSSFGAAAVAIAATAIFALSACTSTSVQQSAASAQRGPINTGTFPNLNIPPQVAAKQFTPEEQQAKMAELTALRGQTTAAVAAPTGTTDPAALRKLAQTHADEALKEIGE